MIGSPNRHVNARGEQPDIGCTVLILVIIFEEKK